MRAVALPNPRRVPNQGRWSVNPRQPCSVRPMNHHMCPYTATVCAAAPKGKDPIMDGLKDLAGFLAPTFATLTGKDSSTSGSRSSKQSSSQVVDDWRSPVYMLILVNAAVFLARTVLPPLSQPFLLSLGNNFGWWQVITSGFMHTNIQHLAETTFMVYTFGRLLERSHGAWALWTTYVASVLGANLLALFAFPSSATKTCAAMSAASAGALGLFVAGLVWPRISRKPLEVVVLTPWVLSACITRYASLKGALVVDGTGIGHMLHVLGAVLAGSLMAGLLKVVDMVQAQLEQQEKERQRLEAEQRRAQRAEDGQIVADALGSAAKVASQIAKKLL